MTHSIARKLASGATVLAVAASLFVTGCANVSPTARNTAIGAGAGAAVGGAIGKGKGAAVGAGAGGRG